MRLQKRPQPMEKRGFIRFFELFSNNFFRLIIINIYITGAVIISVLSVFFLAYTLSIGAAVPQPVFLLKMFICGLPVVFLGPIIGGITRVTRDIVRRTGMFMLSELWEGVKKNWKQSTVIILLQYIMGMLLFIAISFYSETTKGTIQTILIGICLTMTVIVIFSSFYLYMMAVTLKLKIREIIKNSVIFSFLKLFQNILLLLFLIIYYFFFFSLFYSSQTSVWLFGLSVIITCLFAFSIPALVVTSVSFPAIKKHILDPYYEEHPEETSKSVLDDSIIKTETEASKQSNKNQSQIKEASPYIYHNGKMVHKDNLKIENIFKDEETNDKL